jgi:hypothetical protein
MSSSEEARALGRADFWDERYAKASSDAEEKPSHEWFRGFDAPFFEKNLFERDGNGGGKGKLGRILHLGSGDSVRILIFTFCSCNLLRGDDIKGDGTSFRYFRFFLTASSTNLDNH